MPSDSGRRPWQNALHLPTIFIEEHSVPTATTISHGISVGLSYGEAKGVEIATQKAEGERLTAC